MQELFDLVSAYVPFLPEAITIILSLHAFALVVVNMTKTPEDDKWVGVFYRYLEILAGFVTKKSKE